MKKSDEGGAVGYWRRHPKREGQDALEEIHRLGWRIIDPPTYYTVRCPCGEHQRQIHLTPSNPNYWKQAVQHVKRVCPPEAKEES